LSKAGAEKELRDQLAELVEAARVSGKLPELQAVFAELVRGVAETEAVVTEAGVPRRHGIVGASPAMLVVFDLLERVATANVPVLVLGETGTGKELIAKALHELSPRKSEAFMAENCAAVPENLLESELFGHKKGSFTGAVADRAGHFAVADKGTVFLDEIGDMPLPMQSKLLRVLQEGEVRPVGSNKTIKVDVRVVAATNKDLAAMCGTGQFREDLYYRLNVVTIPLPPLRDREGDVNHLVDFFLARTGKELGRTLQVSPEALAALEAWSWPGNVRELENEIQRDAVMSQGVIEVSDLSPKIQAGV
jgi:transcriptional regulator with GAF, ATPase, and Fis domain